MKKDLTCALLLSACCNLALAATSPLATTNDYYYIQPKTTNIFGRVMGENGDYRLVRAEDIAFINEAWAERWELAGGSTWGQIEAMPGGPVVRKGRKINISKYWAEATLGNSVLETESMADRLAEASGGKMTNIVIETLITQKLVKEEMVTNQFAQLKKAKVLAVEANVTYTNEGAAVIKEVWNYDWVKNEGVVADETEFETNRVEGGMWSIRGWGYNRGVGEEIVWVGDWDVGRIIKHTEKDAMSGSVKMRLSFDVGKAEEWLRGEASPKVVESVHAYAVVHVDWTTEEEWWEWNVGSSEAIASNIVDRLESTNVNVLVDMGAAEWIGTNGTRLVYGVSRGMKEITETATGVANAPEEGEIAAQAVVPGLGEDGGKHEWEKNKEIWIKKVYLVIRVKPVASLPGW